jgi:hypothetical protein
MAKQANGFSQAWPSGNPSDWTLSQHGAISPHALMLGMPHFALAVAAVKPSKGLHQLGAARLAITRVGPPRQQWPGPY